MDSLKNIRRRRRWTIPRLRLNGKEPFPYQGRFKGSEGPGAQYFCDAWPRDLTIREQAYHGEEGTQHTRKGKHGELPEYAKGREEHGGKADFGGDETQSKARPAPGFLKFHA
ncbi:hypothetical protein AGMMS49944_20650 [Spirochaetia bacterium]|nr:hypothetical protein AGMMS49944_20650 [Spirochaetia bacterium]